MLTTSPMFSVQPVSAACSPTTTYGTDTLSMTVPSATTYRVWSRIMAPDTTNNSYALEIDGGSCITVGDSAITANTWTWVDYQNATPASKINATLTAGAHTLKLIGTEPGVSVDRIILTSDTACVPTGTGDNCASPPDTTAPTTNITAPSNAATVSGSTVSITANASDDTAVTKVEFYINGTLTATDTTSTYGISWNTTLVANGSYALVTKAYDAAGNIGTSSTVTVTVSNDTAPPTVSVTAPANAASVNGNVTFSANASDNVGVTKVDFSVDGVLKSTDTTSPYSATIDASVLSLGSHTFTAKAYDAVGNTASASVTVTVTDATNPTVNVTAPLNGSTVSSTVTFSASASDNVAVTKVEFSVDGTLKSTDTISPYSVAVDTTTLSNASHTFTAKAYDAAGNTSTSSVTVTVDNTAVGATGDVNSDGKVNIQDLAILVAFYGSTSATPSQGDVNGDNKVTIQDLAILIAHYAVL